VGSVRLHPRQELLSVTIAALAAVNRWQDKQNAPDASQGSTPVMSVKQHAQVALQH